MRNALSLAFASRLARWPLLLAAAAAILSPPRAQADAFPDTIFFSGFEPCAGVQCFQVHCAANQTTSLSGTVFAPNGLLPLPNVQVYVPSTAVGALADGPDYDACGVAPLGHPIAAALSDANGNFTITNVPATSNVQLVMLAGKWRRQITIGNVPACANTPLAADDTRLPRNHSEGHIPHIAIVTGGADSIECVVRKTGIEDAEFSTSSGSGRVHLFAGAGGGATQFDLAHGGATFADATALWSTLPTLSAYDQVMVGCEGGPHAENKPQVAFDAMKAYADAGGRVYLAHWENQWLLSNLAATSWQSVATWNTSLLNPTDPLVATVSNSFVQGAILRSWLDSLGATSPPGSLSIYESRQTAVAADAAKTRTWISAATTSNNAPSIQYFTFTAPVESAAELQKGRLLFTDMHGAADESKSGFPSAGCHSSVTSTTPQEKALIYATFDLQRCVGTTKE